MSARTPKAYPQFGALLDRYLQAEDRAPAWLAARLGVAPSTVSRWLNHATRPGEPETIIRIADLLRVTDHNARQELLAAADYGYLVDASATDAGEVSREPVQAAVPPVSRRDDTKPAPHPATGGRPRVFTAPSLPPQGVHGRATVIDAIAELFVLEDPEATNVPPVALRGMGGIGKTTIAIALSHEENVARFFPDGVLWIALGPAPTIRLLLERWGSALGLDLQAEHDEAACQDRLRAALDHRRALLLVDDVWELRHGQHFLVAGPHCRTLFTTREVPIANGLATRPRTIRVDVLSPNAALAILERLAPEAVAVDPKSAARLCERLEYLPLALTLAGRFLANETDVPSRLRRAVDELIERRAARLSLLQDEGRLGLGEEDTPVSLQAILGMSVERLDPTDQDRFAMLAVFGSEPLTWEIHAAAAVWECSIAEADATVARLIQRGLVERRDGRYWMHALLGDYAEELMEAKGL